MKNVIYTFLSVFVCVHISALPMQGQGDRRVPVLRSFTMTIDDAALPEVEYDVVVSSRHWKELWLGIKPHEKAPDIDFANNFIIINRKDAADPNSLGISVIADSAGVVRVEVLSTRIGFKPSRRTKLIFSELSREGVSGVLREHPTLRRGVVIPIP